MIASFDLDGVILMDGGYPGVYPGVNDIIITGRSYEEYPETIFELRLKGITIIPYFNPIPFKEKTRKGSGIHKGNTLKFLKEHGYDIGIHYDDDEIQIEQINRIIPEVKTVLVSHDLAEKENKRRT